MTIVQPAHPLSLSAGHLDRPQTAAISPTVRSDPTIGRTMTVSVACTTLVMFILTGVPMWLLTGQAWDGIGLGAFCAFWGGPGFGVMIGGVIWTVGQERLNADTQNAGAA